MTWYARHGAFTRSYTRIARVGVRFHAALRCLARASSIQAVSRLGLVSAARHVFRSNGELVTSIDDVRTTQFWPMAHRLHTHLRTLAGSARAAAHSDARSGEAIAHGR